MSDSIALKLEHCSVYPGMLIPSGNRVEFLKANGSAGASNLSTKLFLDNKFKMLIEYASIYDEVWQIRHKQLAPDKLD